MLKLLVGNLTEDEIVSIIAKKLVSRVALGEHLTYPDDARDLLPRAPRIVVSMDAYTVNSLMLPWRTLSDVGWSALTGAVSDVVVKGGVPHGCLIALGVPPSMELSHLEELVDGISDAAKYYDVRVLGGDTNKSSEAWIAISVVGFTTARVPPSRGGMRPGDVVIVTGTYGAMGYAVEHGFERAVQEKWVIEYTKRPKTRTEISYIVENYYKAIDASMDVSDGLGYTLYTMSNLSGRGIIIKEAPRTPEQLVEICRAETRCLLKYALVGGEEYGAVLGVKQGWFKAIASELEYFNIPFAVVGEVSSSPPGLYFNGEKIPVKRYDQFKAWTQNI